MSYSYGNYYDTDGRLVKSERTENGAITDTLLYTYNETGLPAERVPSSSSVKYAYDNAGRIIEKRRYGRRTVRSSGAACTAMTEKRDGRYSTLKNRKDITGSGIRRKSTYPNGGIPIPTPRQKCCQDNGTGVKRAQAASLCPRNNGVSSVSLRPIEPVSYRRGFSAEFCLQAARPSSDGVSRTMKPSLSYSRTPGRVLSSRAPAVSRLSCKNRTGRPSCLSVLFPVQ